MRTTSRRGILSFFLGLLVGILLLAGAIVGTAFWAYKNLKVSTIEGWLGTDIVKGDDPEGIKEKSISDVITWGNQFFTNSQNLTINKINTTFGNYIPTSIPIGDSASFSLESIADIPVTELGANINKLLDAVTIATVRALITLPDIPIITSLDSTLPIMQVFPTIMDSINGDNVSLGSLSTDFGIALPEHAVLAKMKDIPLKNLQNELSTQIMAMTIREVLGDSYCQDGILKAIADIKLANLSAEIPKLRLGQLLDVGEAGSLLYALKDSSLSTIEADVKNIPLNVFIPIDSTSPKILISLKDKTLTQLPSAIENLAIGDIMDATGEGGVLDELINMKKDDGSAYKITEINLAVNKIISTSSVRTLSNYAGSPINSEEHLYKPGTKQDLYDLSLNEFLTEIKAIINAFPIF